MGNLDNENDFYYTPKNEIKIVNDFLKDNYEEADYETVIEDEEEDPGDIYEEAKEEFRSNPSDVDFSSIMEATFLYLVIFNRFDCETADQFWKSAVGNEDLLQKLKHSIDMGGFLVDNTGKPVHTSIHIEHKLEDKSSGLHCAINQY